MTGTQTMGNLPRPVADLIREVCDKYGAASGELLSGRKVAPVWRARAEVIVELRQRGYSYQRIGLWLNVHHSTCVYYYKKYGPKVASGAVEAAPLPDLSGEWAI